MLEINKVCKIQITSEDIITLMKAKGFNIDTSSRLLSECGNYEYGYVILEYKEKISVNIYDMLPVDTSNQ